MRYAFMSFSTPRASLDEMIEIARRYGYSGIEPRIQANHAHQIEFDASPRFRLEVREKAMLNEVAICCVATSCTFSDPENNSEMIDDAKRAIDLTSDIGALCVRVFGGAIPEKLNQEQCLELITLSLQSLATHAASRAVTVCLETHDDWCDPRRVAEIMRRVGHPNIAVNWDIMHPVRKGFATIEESFTLLRPWIRHLHVHDGVSHADRPGVRYTPIGEGEIDHLQAIELLQAAEYQGFISGEWIHYCPWEEHLPREIAQLRDYEKKAAME
ncbi:MAG: sugar phosphate isomerase/epimerase family protein [Candidatus Sumerlaeia bacterium]